jgi:23S rRNA (cytosine1962-C5)-methyltransferase
MTRVQLKRKIANRILNGHPWIFANEVDKWDGDPKAGDIVEVYFSDGSLPEKVISTRHPRSLLDY